MEKDPTRYLITWDQACHAGMEVVGGKGWNLGRLARYGFQIPAGRVLTVAAYDEFISHNGLQELVDRACQSISVGDAFQGSDSLLLNRLREKIDDGTIPSQIMRELTAELTGMDLLESPLAIRSSAVGEDSPQASYAGIHASFLHVRGLEAIGEAIKACYSSLWTLQAAAYRKKLEIDSRKAAAAIVVMEMVEARAAGVGFTCDPQSGRRDRLVIDANFGLGESVVSGGVDPDTYFLDGSVWRAYPRIISRKIGRKESVTRPGHRGGTEVVPQQGAANRQVLPDDQIRRLGLLLLRVLEALGDGHRPQDVEWVHDGRDFFLVQARPVTALPRRTFPALRDQSDIWSNGNYRDAVPMVLSPLIRRFLEGTINTILEASFENIGYRLPDGLQFSRFFQGRLYCNLSALQWAYFDSTGAMPRDINIFWGGHQPEITLENPRPFSGMAGLKRIWRGMKGYSVISAAMKNAPKIHDRVRSAVAAIAEMDLTGLKDDQFAGVYDNLGAIVREFAGEFPFLSATGSMPVVALVRKLSRFFPDRALAIINGLMVGGDAAITSADHGYRLVELAGIARRDEEAYRFFTAPHFAPLSWRRRLSERSSFKQAFDKFLDDYGHRAVYELDIINPRWNEDPSYLLDVISSTLHTAELQSFKERQKEKRRQTWRQIEETVPIRQHGSLRKLVKNAQAGAAVREQTKSVLARITEAYRMLARELGSRLCSRSILQHPDDIYFSTWPELFVILAGEWDGEGMQALIDARKATRKELEALAPPDVILGEQPQIRKSFPHQTGNYLAGVAVAAGKAAGKARLIHHPEEGRRLQPGDVMVAPATDPGWTPLFLKAAALIMETGGYLSHGAIVAREYGVPAVVNVPEVLKIVRDGMPVTVDGDEGKIFLH